MAIPITPLRYPGGKAKIANFMKLIFRQNQLMDGHYAEPYAGGAGVAWALLTNEYVSHIHINDIDESIHAFWQSALYHTDELCNLIQSTEVTTQEWQRQKLFQQNKQECSTLELGFSTFFLNRTNISGVIKGGIIGGKNQSGKYKIDARYNKPALIQRIRKIASYRNRVNIYKQDAADFIHDIIPNFPRKTLTYFDPPYYIKGNQLYQNYYKRNDHEIIAQMVISINQNWIVSYDNVPEISEIYAGQNSRIYDLCYSAGPPSTGSEIMFFSEGLDIPDVPNPSRVTAKMLTKQRQVILPL